MRISVRYNLPQKTPTPRNSHYIHNIRVCKCIRNARDREKKTACRTARRERDRRLERQNESTFRPRVLTHSLSCTATITRVFAC